MSFFHGFSDEIVKMAGAKSFIGGALAAALLVTEKGRDILKSTGKGALTVGEKAVKGAAGAVSGAAKGAYKGVTDAPVPKGKGFFGRSLKKARGATGPKKSGFFEEAMMIPKREMALAKARGR